MEGGESEENDSVGQHGKRSAMELGEHQRLRIKWRRMGHGKDQVGRVMV